MDYSKLRGAIREKFGSQEEFAAAIEMSTCSLSAKLNGRSEWKANEIVVACQALGVPLEQAWEYFFLTKML